ncbi:MAG TPA: bifunctional phosphopantothenoylcysteine decarboxylase/phosphopantothenate--cysteine ligase CoaBC [Thermoanaerobaculia bacterium]|nr:bifunctional phosphopantothenoylcysteine decarboxylase/phosphopantothenate--cysteine ligase CoaBC [Thermoanaerobaculia bacterium]
MQIVLGVTGGIAAYKSPELVRRLRDAGADVRVILTPNGSRFVSPLSLATVSGHGVIVEQWGDPDKGGVDHIELARWAELLLIAPATANVIAKLAVGIADDALSTYAVAHRQAILIAPAMNTFMLLHPTVQQNLAALRARGVMIMEPDAGLLACGDEGAGRMPDPPVIVERVRLSFRARDLEGRSVLVTAGPTREPIDPVRFLSNRSSGKMGYALADAARRRGAAVTLVAGPTALPAPPGVSVVPITTASEMREAVLAALPRSHVVIKAAAVADYAPIAVAPQKIRKENGNELTLTFRRTPDILEEIAAAQPRPFVVAFAAETEALEAHARDKLMRKNADLIVANDVADPSIGFDSDQNEVLVIDRNGQTVKVEKSSKFAVANRILDLIVERLR